MKKIQLGFSFLFEGLYLNHKLKHLDSLFFDYLSSKSLEMADQLQSARVMRLPELESSLLITQLAPYLEMFLVDLFQLHEMAGQSRLEYEAIQAVLTCKRQFIQRQVAKQMSADDVVGITGVQLLAELEALIGPFTQAGFSMKVLEWLQNPDQFDPQIKTAKRFAAWVLHTPEGQSTYSHHVLFNLPKKGRDVLQEIKSGDILQRQRDGFSLTDAGTDTLGAQDQAHYCIWCHKQDKDSCSKGLKDRKTGEIQKDASGVDLEGCPLEEKISEMNQVYAKGHKIGALAVAIIDNPMLAGTGHRICNDCMKSCIYQKQDPVNIPEIETRVLKDVLELPWGFEIYSLLTRWNPLNFDRPLPRQDTGRHVLVVGMGPAGYTLAHHLMNDGHSVMAIDGAKLEPLDAKLTGVDPQTGMRVDFNPIENINTIFEPLDKRIVGGFGGVAEYGITVRWDKNFLKVIRLLLERRQQFLLLPGVRMGGTITTEQAFEMGFDHVALCAGAGKPQILNIKNRLAPGVRQASDFLMALQLTGAQKQDSIANLQMRLPVVVIGGGLTAIDTATEALAYYPIQVEKFLKRYETLCEVYGSADQVRAEWSAEETVVADEFIAHAQDIRRERVAAKVENRTVDIRSLVQKWGGVKVCYRKGLRQSPSFRLNHEEVMKALEEGIEFVESLSPKAIEIDTSGHAAAVTFTDANGAEITHPARAVYVAAGTKPNTVIAREEQGFEMDGHYFRGLDGDGKPTELGRSVKFSEAHVLASVNCTGKGVSFFGDLHPTFAGNVVKAMASAKRGYPVLTKLMHKRPENTVTREVLFNQLNTEARAEVVSVNYLADKIVEIIFKAPMAARAFKPGQFYRLQNFESLAPRLKGTTLAMEGLALTGAWVDREKGLISTIVLEMGGSSDLCAQLKPGEPVILMGPTGTPTETPGGETVLLVGGGLGNAVLFSIGQALRAAGSKVLYCAGYRKLSDRYKVEQIEAAADQIIWCSDEAPGFEVTRPQDQSYVGNIVEAIEGYARSEKPAEAIGLKDINRIICIGSDRMMAAVTAARHGVLKPYLSENHKAIASINSPMQCMMKEICAQCLQLHRDPKTGEETVIFSCFNQDQDMDWVDFGVLADRLQQNSVQEKLTKLWIQYCLN